MRRKIIKQGNNSYTLTLPIDWIREEKLENGEVEIEQEDNHLLIRIPNDIRKPESKISLDLDNYNERTIMNILSQFYRKGYDQIILTYKDEKQLEKIKDVTRKTLLGFEVVEEKLNLCTVQNIAEPSGEKFDVILRKIFLTINDEGKEILEDLQNKKFSKMKKRDEIKNIVDNYTNLCRRLIIKDKIGGTKNSYLNLLIVARLSLVYHAYYYMYKFASANKIKVSKDTLSLLEEANKLFDMFYEAFYKKDLKIADKMVAIRDNLTFNNLYSLFQKTKGKENVILYHIGEIMRVTLLACANIFGLI